MRIKKVSLYRLEAPMMCGRFPCSLEPGVEQAEVVVTRVETECGLVGYGESGAVGGYPNYSPGILFSSAELIKRHLIDKDPRHLNAIQQAMALIDGHGAIKSGFDMACWDILGKSMDKPIYEVLGGKLMDSVPLFRSLPTEAPEDMAQSVRDWRSEGYRMFQLHVGHGDIQADLQRISGVLSQRQEDESYTVDVAGHWRVDEALYILNKVRDLDFTIEQPCWTVEDCMSLRTRINFPMKLDNSLNSVQDVLRAYANHACESIALKINKIGGISAVRLARDLATVGGMGITYCTQWGTEITSAALTHLGMTTHPSRLISSVDIHNYSSVSVAADDSLVVANGKMWFSDDKPGLGITVDDAALGEPVYVIKC